MPTSPASAFALAPSAAPGAFTADSLKLRDAARDNLITLATASDEAADRALTIPALGGDKTLALSDAAQTFKGAQTFSDAAGTGDGTLKSLSAKNLNYNAATHVFADQAGTGNALLQAVSGKQLQLGAAPATADALADTLLATGGGTTHKTLVLQQVAAQSGDPFQIQNSAGSVKTQIATDGSLACGGPAGSGEKILLSVSGIAVKLASGGVITFTSGGSASATADIALKRAAANFIGFFDSSTGGGGAEFKQMATPASPSTDSARLYAKDASGTAKLYAMNEAGTEFLLSPHSATAPDWLYDVGDPDPHLTEEFQHYLGRVRYVNHTRAARLQEKFFNGLPLPADQRQRQIVFEESFDAHNKRRGLTGPTALAIRDWDADQAAAQRVYNAERAQELYSRLEYESLSPEQQVRLAAPEVRESKDVRKPKPLFLK